MRFAIELPDGEVVRTETWEQVERVLWAEDSAVVYDEEMRLEHPNACGIYTDGDVNWHFVEHFTLCHNGNPIADFDYWAYAPDFDEDDPAYTIYDNEMDVKWCVTSNGGRLEYAL